MKLTAEFSEDGLALVLHPQTDAEQRMVGAVINQPFEAPPHYDAPIHTDLITAQLGFEGHWSNKKITSLKLFVSKQHSGES